MSGAADELDVVVVGSGVAGLSAAVRAAETLGLRVGVVSKAELELATTRWAQGGVAAALSGDPEEIDLHLADTLAAGAGLCDVDAVRVLVDEGPTRVEELIALGARFDRDADGRLELAREGGHSVPRVIHAGGVATGAEIERALVAAVRASAAVLYERAFALDLIVEDGRCRGVVALDAAGHTVEVRARHTLLATGGAGQLFSITTNPSLATGDGVAMAIAAGAAVADLEFFQFHPTALARPSMPRPLLSEALRGHGALLRDDRGERFVDELLPRDVVSRAITRVLSERGVDHVWLDATGLDHFASRFPTIASELNQIGLDPTSDWLPVAPAAHHQCGGVVTDLNGATSIPGLWACGEISCTGVHGANRLASNSLLEGMVFGPRVVESIASGVDGPGATGAMRAVLGTDDDDDLVIGGRRLEIAPLRWSSDSDGSAAATVDVDDQRHRLQRVMTTRAGVLRDASSLADALDVVRSIAAGLAERSADRDVRELANLVRVGHVLLCAAIERTESRGAHARTDFPELSPELHCRLVVAHP